MKDQDPMIATSVMTTISWDPWAQKKQPQCSSHSTESEIEAGNQVAVHQAQNEEWPQIGQVLHVTEANIEVEWYDGAYSEPWITVKRKINRKYEYWTEMIPFVSVILADIRPTRSCRLQKNTIAHLKCIKETVWWSDVVYSCVITHSVNLSSILLVTVLNHQI